MVYSAISTEQGPELKEDQQMGFNVYSNDGFFVVRGGCGLEWVWSMVYVYNYLSIVDTYS